MPSLTFEPNICHTLSRDAQVDIQAALSALAVQIDGSTTAEGTVSYGSVVFPLNELDIALRSVTVSGNRGGFFAKNSPTNSTRCHTSPP